MKQSVFTKAAFVATLAVGALVSVPASAEAQARLNIEGSANLLDQPNTAGANLLIDFLAGSPPTIAGTPVGTVRAVPTISGEFMPEIMPGTTGTIRDLVSSSTAFLGSPTGANGAPPNTGLPLADFLTIGGYTFSLTSAASGNAFGPISLIPAGSSTVAIFSINGRVTGGDFGTDGRDYTAVFSAQFAGLSPDEVFDAINSGGTLPVSFSAEFTVASVVPEPSTYALMGAGLGALGLVLRRRRSVV